jgi:hypothetical protein
MTKLEQIQSSIEKLSAREIAELRDWLEELDARLFDEKIERDAKAGKLDKLADEARANLKAGRGEEFQAARACGTSRTRGSSRCSMPCLPMFVRSRTGTSLC